MKNRTKTHSGLLRQLACEEAIEDKFFEMLELGLSAGWSPADVCFSVRSLAERFLGQFELGDETVKRLVIVLGELRAKEPVNAASEGSC